MTAFGWEEWALPSRTAIFSRTLENDSDEKLCSQRCNHRSENAYSEYLKSTLRNEKSFNLKTCVSFKSHEIIATPSQLHPSLIQTVNFSRTSLHSVRSIRYLRSFWSLFPERCPKTSFFEFSILHWDKTVLGWFFLRPLCTSLRVWQWHFCGPDTVMADLL